MRSNPAITSVHFKQFKAFKDFTLDVKHLNVLVGPNNCGKSTLLGAFRILAHAIRKARHRNPEQVEGPSGPSIGYWIPTKDLTVSLENVHTDLRDTNTEVVFKLSNKLELVLYFPVDRGCIMLCRGGSTPRTTSTFKSSYPIIVDHIPILGPVEYQERLVAEETVKLGEATHRASRHFRSYWHYNRDDFKLFADRLKATWPGMSIELPEIQYGAHEHVVHMMCYENRMPRELYWSGFGFQVWCQIISHLTRAREADIVVLDEPEIYLHPELQRQLIHLLREAGPDVVIATHSTEIVSEADPSEIVLVDKKNSRGKRIGGVDRVQDAFDVLGSSQNVTLTQLARNRKVLFVEGYDFKILKSFARKLELQDVANETGLTVVPIEGFSNWTKLKDIAWAFSRILGDNLYLSVILDRDYRCADEVEEIRRSLLPHMEFVHIHERKEIENYVLFVPAIERALEQLLEDRKRRGCLDLNQAYPER